MSNKTMFEMLEENLLDEYFLLVRRIPGLSMSIDDFMNTPSRIISYLLDKEYEIIAYEEKEREKMELEMKSTSKGGKMIPNKYENSKEVDLAIKEHIK